MDWNTKWDLENLVNQMTAKVPKQKITSWGIKGGEGIMGTGPFCSYERKGSSSGSELAPGSSTRSSKSVCTDSSFKEKNTQVTFGNMIAFSGDIEDLHRAEHDESSPPPESSVGSGESLIGLELGKRMYFENNGCGSSTRTASAPENHVSSIVSTVKKIKSSDLNTARCQVEGCKLDLSAAKDYHRKHKVCASHSKCPKVVIDGLERRFCQQCSRFHSLSEFDENKRSCRKRLSDHNARRRKPQLDPGRFNMFSLPSTFSAFTCIDGRPPTSFISNNVQHIYSRSSSDSAWASSFNSKFTTKNGCQLKFGETGDLDEQLQLAGTRLTHATNELRFSELLSSKGTKSETLCRGFKESALPPNLDSAPDIDRALSLLSNNSWDSFAAPDNSLEHSILVNHMHHQPSMQGFLQILPQTSSELCQADHHATGSFDVAANDTTHFQPFRAPFENVLFPNLFN